MLVLLLAASAGIVGGTVLWANRGTRLTCLDADSEIPDTVPAEWVEAYRSDKD